MTDEARGWGHLSEAWADIEKAADRGDVRLPEGARVALLIVEGAQRGQRRGVAGAREHAIEEAPRARVPPHRDRVTEERRGWERGDVELGHRHPGLERALGARGVGVGEELVGALVWLCSDAASFVTGAVIPVDGGFSCFSGI